MQESRILGENIRKARKKAGLTQSELGELCGWDNSQARIGHYENGRREPSLADIRLLATHTNTTMMELLEGADNSLAGQIAKRLEGVRPDRYDQILQALDSLIDLSK